MRWSQAAPTGVTASFILLQAAIVRFLFDADESRVYWLGRPIDGFCTFYARFGLPCPACGLTRSVVLALHGHLLRAWNVAPGGAAGLVAGLAFAAGLAALALFRATGHEGADHFRRRLRRCAMAGSAAIIVVWGGGWATAFAAALHRMH